MTLPYPVVFEERKRTVRSIVDECSLRDVLQMLIEICDEKANLPLANKKAWRGARDNLNVAQDEIIEFSDDDDNTI